MLTDSYEDIARQTGAFRGGMRGLPLSGLPLSGLPLSGLPCSGCAGLGDASSATGGLGVPNWFIYVALGLGAIASGLVIYDRIGKRKKRRLRVRRITDFDGRRTAQLPAESMRDVVFGHRT